jgi:uncharacterized protein with GYD domain
MPMYYFAFVRESGAWDIVKSFEADDDKDAMHVAAETAKDDFMGRADWYVLDINKENINV